MSRITFTMLKPDSVRNGNIGAILDKITKSGFKIKAMKFTQMSKEKAGEFYAIHKERPFFKDLVSFMVSGPVIVQVLQGENAVALYRKVMGATNPQEAEVGTIRKEFALSIEANSVHGSDSIENAKKEISFFFSETEIFED